MPITLITSNSIFLLDQKLNELLSKKENIVTYHYWESSLIDLLEEASCISLFNEMKYIVVKNADFFGKEKLNDKETELLLTYLANPYANSTLIFTTLSDLDKRKSVTKQIISKGTLLELKAPKNYELVNDVKKNLSNYQIGEHAIKYLIDTCLGNYDLIMNEVTKLTSFFKTREIITLETMKEIIPPNKNDNAFKFIDAVISKDLETSLTLLEELYSLKYDPVQLINLLVREYRLMYYYKIFASKNYSLPDIMRELKLQDWQVNKIIKNSSHYHKDDLKDAILKLSELDYQIKSFKVDRNMILYSFLIQMMEY